MPNIRFTGSERTFLDADYTSGTSLTVISNLGFADNDWAIVGEVGDEKTEAIDVTGTSGNATITISAAYKFSHNKTTTIYRSEWDQITLERKLTSDSSWTTLSTFNIQWDKLETIYIDTTGDDTYDYRFRFYNSLSLLSSEYSPTVAGSGFIRRSVGAMILNVRRKIKDPNRQRITDTEIIQKLSDGQIDIEGIMPRLSFLKVDTFETSTGIASAAATAKYALSSYTDFNYLAGIKYKLVSGGNTLLWELDPKTDDEFDPLMYNQGSPVSNDYTLCFKIVPPDSTSTQGYFRVYPVPETTAGTFYPVYYKKFTALTDISDFTDLIFPEILEDYAAWRIHELLGNDTQATSFKNLYYGPNSESNSDQLTGLALLKSYDDSRKRPLAKGRSLIRFRGRRLNKSTYGSIVDRDYFKEFFMN